MNEYNNKPNNHDETASKYANEPSHKPRHEDDKAVEYSNEPIKQDNSSKKKLSLSRNNKMIAGVCGGFAEYLNMDATFIRIIFVALSIMSAVFPMLLFYIACWAIIPNQGS